MILFIMRRTRGSVALAKMAQCIREFNHGPSQQSSKEEYKP